MSDRLKDLQRQRALAQEQIEWLDREIAREMGLTAPVPPARVAPTAPLSPATPAVADADADKIIEQYRSAKPIHNQVKQGCLVYFFGAFAVVGIVVALLYIFHRH